MAGRGLGPGANMGLAGSVSDLNVTNNDETMMMMMTPLADLRARYALRRMLAGLQALGRVRVVGVPDSPELSAPTVGGALVSPGSWCADAPLWGNLFAPAPPAAPGGVAGPRGLQTLPRGRLRSPSGRWAPNGGGLVRSALLTVGDAVRAKRTIQGLASRPGYPYRGPWADADSELADLEDVLSALPVGWRAAATAATPPAPGPLAAFLESDGLSPAAFSRPVSARELQVECGLVSGLGWRLGGTSVRVSALSVRQATALQLRPLADLRARYQRDFVDAVAPVVVRGDPTKVEACCKAVVTAQRQLWKLRWDNYFKEVYWRLVLNGLATAERMHMHDCDCVCGQVQGGQPDRRHHFWECAVAQAVVAQLQQQLAGWCPGALQPHHVLCMLCPEAVGAPGARPLHKGVWRVVCLAAINAMDLGRRAANLAGMQQRQQAALEAAQQQLPRVPEDQLLITDLLEPEALSLEQQQHQAQVQQRRQAEAQLDQQQRQQQAAAKLEEVKQQAVARFWELLQDFVVLRAAPRAWLPQLAPDHPFLRVTSDLLGVHCVASSPGAA